MTDDQLAIAALGFAKLQEVVQAKLDRKRDLIAAIAVIDAELLCAAQLLAQPHLLTASGVEPVLPMISHPAIAASQIKTCRECAASFVGSRRAELCAGCRRLVRQETGRLIRAKSLRGPSDPLEPNTLPGDGGLPVLRNGTQRCLDKDTPRTSYGELRNRILGAA